MKIHYLPLSCLSAAPFQPVTRATETNTIGLRDSIKNGGQLYPILVTEDKEHKGRYLIFDGHRRKIALQALNRETGMCIVFKDKDLAKGFAAANEVKKLSGYESQEIFLKNSEALPRQTRRNNQKASEFLGMMFFKEVVFSRAAVAYSLFSEGRAALRDIAVVNPAKAVKYKDTPAGREKLGRAVLAAGIDKISSIRKNKDLHVPRGSTLAEQKGKLYLKTLKL